MENNAKMTPKDFFLNLGIVVTLYTSIISFLTLVFEIINRAFPDALSGNYYYTAGYYSGSIRFAIASLVIMFPICIVLSYFNNRQAIAIPEKKKLAIRRWLSYVTVFLASLAMAIDLITLVNTFLGGEITTRFVLKVLAVLVVTGLVFAYYIFDLRRDVISGSSDKIFAIVASLIILIGIGAGFFYIGSPLTQRAQIFDGRRINDLQTIQWQLVSYWQKKGMLPKALIDLNDPISNFVVPSDPKTGEAYEYIAGEGTSFNLCSTFELSQNPNSPSNVTAPSRVDFVDQPVSVKGGTNDNWNHAAGRTCFERTIDPILYPRVKNAPIGQ